MNILVTGFNAFLRNTENPTEEVLKLLPKSIYGNKITKVLLPVVFDDCFDILLPIIEETNPDIIINLGLAGNRKAINLERVAINIKDYPYPDNNGVAPQDEFIIESGENAYLSTLPLRKIMKHIQLKNIPVEISNTAGTYVCNNLMYHVLHHISVNNLDIKAGFIHVPYMREQLENIEVFSLPIDVILEGVIDSIKACL
ncbi:MAG: pyroglutamyl-peptidase I [Candidatus Izimaplasma sp.]|nr:pyroglutamyl-peptidase I [Candidatus Izimaplasma bacterium]